MKTINDVINWIIQSGLLMWLFYFGFAVGKPWIDSKIKHAKTQQQREAWTLLEQAAMTNVNALVSANMPGYQKLLEASDLVQSYLSDHGIKVDMKTVQAAVQAAYEKSPLTGNDQLNKAVESLKAEGISTGNVHSADTIHAGVEINGKPQGTDPVMEAIQTAPNRADNVEEGDAQ